MKPIRTTVPDDVLATLRAIARQRGTSLAAVARCALVDYADGNFTYRLQEIGARSKTTIYDSKTSGNSCQVEKQGG